MKRDTIRQVANLLAVFGVIGVNILANALPINGQTTGEVARQFDVYFFPAGYAFSIWGVIYLGLLAFGFYQVLPGQRDNPRLRRIDYLFLLSSVANIAWIFLWHYEFFPLTLLVMLTLLGALVAIYQILEVGRIRVSAAEKWLVHVPFSIYLGWVTVATIANVTILLAYLNWDGWGISGPLWTIILLGTGLVIATAVSLPRSDAAYPLVIVWSFIAITIEQGDTPQVAVTAAVLAVVALILAISAFIHGRRTWLPGSL